MKLPDGRTEVARCEVVLDDAGTFHVEGYFGLLAVTVNASDSEKLEASLLMLGVPDPPKAIQEIQEQIREKWQRKYRWPSDRRTRTRNKVKR